MFSCSHLAILMEPILIWVQAPLISCCFTILLPQRRLSSAGILPPTLESKICPLICHQCCWDRMTSFYFLLSNASCLPKSAGHSCQNAVFYILAPIYRKDIKGNEYCWGQHADSWHFNLNCMCIWMVSFWNNGNLFFCSLVILWTVCIF